MKKHGFLWWVFIGWWWVPFTLPFRVPVWIVRLIRWALKPAAKPAPVGGDAQAPESELKKETHKVAGVSYYQDALKALGIKNPDFAKTKKQLIDEDRVDERIHEYTFAPQNVELVPEPDNPYSENGNATKVVVDGQHIGYIKSGSSAHVRKLIDADRIQQVTCFIGGGKSKMITRDEDDERYILESDEIGFYARLTITIKPE